ncbi:MAG TPA: plastocyanin/azurin family copper-binding protein [Ktedonobacterales bacterium]|nr:plastocyanin/azurin family copper-binding protein [Ktedonobacterales bacterium]
MAVAARHQLLIRIAGVFGALLCLLLMAACGGSSSGGTAEATAPTAPTAPTATTAPAPATPTQAASSGTATINMDAFSFGDSSSVTIKAGQKVNFDDSAGGTHVLVIGSNGQFKAQSGAPSALNSANGVAFAPGDTKEITFPTAGTYKITCKIHPSMQATVTVTS